MRRMLLRGCAPAVLLLASATAFAATYRVKADAVGSPHDGSSWDRAFLTVQAGINAASSGDEVWVAQGAYKENLTTKDGLALLGGFSGTGATPDARNWNSYVTTLDGNSAGTVITVPAGAGSGTVIEGFTITKGTGTAPLGYTVYGGGIYCKDSSYPVIRNCSFIGNTLGTAASPPSRGGAIACGASCSPSIESCTFTGNTALYGGAVYAGDRNPRIRDCTFEGNAAAAGGAISVPTDCYSTITGCLFRNNTASTGGGAIICDSASTATLMSNVFQDNASTGPGGAVYCNTAGASGHPCRIVSNVFRGNAGNQGDAVYSQGTVYILNNTFHANHAYYAGQESGTLFFKNIGPVYNNILANNDVAIAYYVGLSGGESHFHNNCFHQNTLNHDARAPDLIGLNANFEGNPGFHDAASGDFHISALSPCSEAGDSTYRYNPDTDIDLQPRLAGTAVEIGADEIAQVLVFTTQPLGGSKGSPLSRQPAVSVEDGYGNVFTNAIGMVTVALTSGSGTPGAALTGTKTVSLVAGVATYTDLAVSLGGTGYTLDASSADMAMVVSAGFTVTVPVVRVSTLGNDQNEGTAWDAPKRTVTAGLTGADHPDGEVWVRKGTYEENVTLPVDVTLLGGFEGTETSSSQRSASTNVTIIDGGGSGATVTVSTGATSATLLDGFTITGGAGRALGTLLNRYYGGGGIYMKSASPRILHNIITKNTATLGGGIYVEGGAPLIQYDDIHGNQARCTSKVTGAGGGIAVTVGSTGKVVDCLVAGNSGTGTNPLLDQGAVGGGIACSASNITVRNCTVADNASSGDGGGFFLLDSSPDLINNIAALNDGGLFASNSHPTFACNDFALNGAYNTSGVPYPSGLSGNISVDPRFLDAAHGNFRIAGGSPCCNAGDTSAVGAREYDLDGHRRVFGGIVDMGAYEVVPFTASDVLTAIRYSCGIQALTGAGIATYDVWPNVGDGRVTLEDALRVMRKVAEFEPNP